MSDHLHAHAYIAPADQLGWWRGIAYGSLAWYAVDDLIAEIRCVIRPTHVSHPLTKPRRSSESVSNNRVKSNRKSAPMDLISDAGTGTGAVNSDGLAVPTLVVSDVEETDERSSRPSTR